MTFDRILSRASLLCLLGFGLCSAGFAQNGLYITEFMADNETTLRDDFGEFSDWIEIYNGANTPVSLEGYYLTDDPAQLTRWRFPATNLPPHRFLIVFASDRDRAIPGAVLHTNFKLAAEGEYLALVHPDGTTIVSQYQFAAQTAGVSFGLAAVNANEIKLVPTNAVARVLVPSLNIGTTWTQPAFNDASWLPATAAIGFETNALTPSYAGLIGTDLHAAMLPVARPSAYLRIPIVIDAPLIAADVQFQMQYDDGFTAYLNGREIARRNAATNSTWNSTAIAPHANSLAVLPELIPVPGLQDALRVGTNYLAIHGMNRTTTDPDFFMRPEIMARDIVVQPEAARFFSIPTPGAANATGLPDVSGTVLFSHQSGLFTNAIPLTLSVMDPPPGTVIRYTLDRSVPTELSPAYTAPLRITNTVQVRARVFEPGNLPGALRSESYVFLHSALLNFSSDLPVIVLHTLGGGIITDGADKPGYLEIHDTFRGRSSLLGTADVKTRAGAKVRGSSTGQQAKKALTIEFWDDAGEARDLSPLGLPPESDWILYPPNNAEPVLIHNPYAYHLYSEFGRYSVRTRFVELYLNESGGALTTTNYFGIYVLVEKIKIGPDRVDIEPLRASDRTPPDVTGGYLFKIDRRDPGDSGFNGAGADLGGIGPCYVDPKESEIKSLERDPQEQYVTSFFGTFGATLASANYANPTNGYAKYVDVEAAVDFHLLSALTFTVDANVLSTFFYKPRDGKLTFGPPWDFDRSMGSLDPGFERDKSPRVWAVQTYLFHMPWWDRMFTDPNFYQRWIDRYQELRRSLFSVSHLHELVDHFVAQVREAQVREVARWPGFTTPRTGTLNAAAGYTFNFGSSGYQGEVEQMKHWLLERVNFIDSNFVGPPSVSAAGGPIVPGFSITLSGPAGASIYYTLDGSDPRLPGGSLNPRATLASGPILLNANARLFARCRNLAWTAPTGGFNPALFSTWSGFIAESYYATIPPLVMTEIMYHPVAPPTNSPFTAEDFEYLELKNIGATTLALKGASFTSGIQFTFPDRTLAQSASILVVRNRAAFESRYGTRDNIAGEYTGDLDNGGERLVLAGTLGEPLLDFVYQDTWHPITDGDGFSLAIRDENAPRNTWSNAASWRVSALYGGSPGINDPAAPALAAIVINEILSLPLPGGQDAVELFNPTLNPVDVSGWYLTDNANRPRKFQIRTGSIVPANGYLVLREQNLIPEPGQPAHFGLDADAEEVFLFSADGAGNLTGYRTGTEFGTAEAGVSFGRHAVNPTLLPGQFDYPAQLAATLGSQNTGPSVGPIVISEIHYHPPDLYVNRSYWDAPENEFVELRNITDQDVDLFDPVYPTNTWRLRSAVDFAFPGGFTLPPQGVLLLVNFDPATEPGQLEAFRAQFGLDDSFAIWGPMRGKLDNSSETVRLLRPGPPNPTNLINVPYIVVDQIQYQDRYPWPLPADGYGYSLQRLALGSYGNDPGNWIAAAPTAGRANAGAEPAPSIIQQPQSIEVVGGQSVSFSVSATGPASLRFQWLRDGRMLSGQNSAVLTVTNVSAADEAQYTVVIYVSGNFVVSAPASLSVINPAQILIPPASQSVNAGSNVTFRVSATGAGPLRYRWIFNGEPVPAATNDTLTLTNVALPHQGAYAVIVSDNVGATTSPAALLTVLVKPVITLQPQPTTAVVGETATFSFSAYGTPPFWYRWLRGTTPLAGYATNTTPQLYTALVLTNVQTTNRALYQVQFGNPAQSQAFSTSVRLNVVIDADTDGIEDDWETVMGLNPALATDAGLDPDRDGVSNLDEYRAGTNPNLADSHLAIESITNPNGRPILTFATASNRTYSVQMKEALQPGSWVTITNIPARLTDLTEVFTDPLPASASRWYRLVAPQQPRVSAGPIILASPSPLFVRAGALATFEVIAVGTGTVRYQWFRNGTSWPGQTSARVTIPSVQAADAGLYSVTVSDVLGATSSSAARLNVVP